MSEALTPEELAKWRGSADAVADDYASNFGGLEECAQEGGTYREPVQTWRPTIWQRVMRWLATT